MAKVDNFLKYETASQDNNGQSTEARSLINRFVNSQTKNTGNNSTGTQSKAASVKKIKKMIEFINQKLEQALSIKEKEKLQGFKNSL